MFGNEELKQLGSRRAALIVACREERNNLREVSRNVQAVSNWIQAGISVTQAFGGWSSVFRRPHRPEHTESGVCHESVSSRCLTTSE